MSWENRCVVVTGAGGFIGSHLVEALAGHGARVKALLRYNSRQDIGLLTLLPRQLQENVEFVFSDLRDSDAVKGALQSADMVFHLGALISIPYSYRHPRQVVETNVLGTLNVMTAALALGISRVVHTSTSEVYGTAQRVPMDESHPLKGQSPYAASKIGADKIAESFYHTYELPVSIVRPFNTYGPRQSGRAVVPTIISQVLAHNVLTLGALHPARDLTFVSDTVDAFLAAAESQDSIGEEINIGSGAEISIGDLARKIMALMGREVQIVTETQRLRPTGSEVQRLWADNRKAKDLLHWEPKVILEEGLRRTIDWISKNPERYHPDVYEI